MNIEFSFGWNHAGLVTIWWGETHAVHLFPAYAHWQLGYREDWYNGPWYSFGCGPLLLVCW